MYGGEMLANMAMWLHLLQHQAVVPCIPKLTAAYFLLIL